MNRYDSPLTPEQIAAIKDEDIDFSAGPGIAVREYQTDAGPADYVLFVDRKPAGVIEAKPDHRGQNITTVEEQSAAYTSARLKWVNNCEPLPFVYEATGVLTRFTDMRDPKPRSREVFNFPRPETMQQWHSQPDSLRARLRALPPLDPTGLRACQVNAIENLETSFKDDRPRALIQMATGSGKTYTAITSVYRLLNTPTPSACSFSSTPGIWVSRPSRNSWPTCPATTTASSPSCTTSSASSRPSSPGTARSASAPSSACTRCSRTRTWTRPPRSATRRR